MRTDIRLRLLARHVAMGRALPDNVTLTEEEQAYMSAIHTPVVTDAAIAAIVKCSRENVRQVRAALGLPPAHAAPRTARKLDPLLADEALCSMLGTVPDTVLARTSGTSSVTVANARRVLDREPAPRASRIRPFRELLGEVPDSVVAEKAGTSTVAVVRFRQRHGIPSHRRACAQGEDAP